MPFYLYRHFNANGQLLYVGQTYDAGVRLRAHKYGSVWADKITRSEVSQFNSRVEALEAEYIAIKTEKPLYNKHHNTCADGFIKTPIPRMDDKKIISALGGVSATSKLCNKSELAVRRWEKFGIPYTVKDRLNRDYPNIFLSAISV